MWTATDYELDFLEKFLKIHPDLQNGPSISYNLNENEHIYHSDFYIPSLNLVIEIKNSYLAKKYFDEIYEKKKATLLTGYNYIMITNKHYKKFKQLYGRT